MTLDATATPDQIMERICEALNQGMNRFEQRGETYGSIVEKHRDAVNKVFYGKDTETGTQNDFSAKSEEA